MNCDICGGEMEKTSQHDYIIYKCRKCGHEVAKNIRIISIIGRTYVDGIQKGYMMAIDEINNASQ